MSTDRDYVLGTHDAEINRLGLQHSVWRAMAHTAWRRAGFAAGQRLLDVGSGPGWATLDLAQLVGPTGHVHGVDRSRRFLDTLQARAREQGFENVSVTEADLDEASFEADSVDGAWCRWVLAFVLKPRDLLTRVTRAIKPGGTFVSHEYFDYASWRSLPPSAPFTEFVALTIQNWRNNGGEPDVGLQVPQWLEEMGFRIESVTPLIYAITPSDPLWQWPATFMEVGLDRLIELGVLTAARGADMRAALRGVIQSPHSRMITPGVVEVIARRG
jgi:SAM-dependent methyltransferase